MNSFEAMKEVIIVTLWRGYFSGRKKSDQIIVKTPVFFLQLISIDFLLK
jgi:hypothetical protein